MLHGTEMIQNNGALYICGLTICGENSGGGETSIHARSVLLVRQ